MKVRSDNVGYFAIGIWHPKRAYNLGTLWRSAYILGAAYIFTIGKNYKKQTSDVLKTWARIPYFHFETEEDFLKQIPYDCWLVGAELDENAVPITDFDHPKRAIYLLGAEDNGIPPKLRERCQHLVQLPGCHSLNVAVAGSVVMYDRQVKSPSTLPTK